MRPPTTVFHCGGWTLVLKTSQGIKSSVLSGSDSINWLTPTLFGDATSLASVSALGKAYTTVKFNSILIRSVLDANKRVSWKHPNNYSSLYSVIQAKIPIKDGVVISGSPQQLDYISGCLTGNEPTSRYYGFYVDDNGGFNTYLLSKLIPSWGASLIGWGSTNYSSNYNVAGGFGFSQMNGQNVDFSRHYHLFGNACTSSGWNGITGNAMFNSHALFIR